MSSLRPFAARRLASGPRHPLPDPAIPVAVRDCATWPTPVNRRRRDDLGAPSRELCGHAEGPAPSVRGPLFLIAAQRQTTLCARRASISATSNVHKATCRSTSTASLPKHVVDATEEHALRCHVKPPATDKDANEPPPPRFQGTAGISTSRARRQPATSGSRSRRSDAGPTPDTSAATGRPEGSGASRASSSTSSSARCTATGRHASPTPDARQLARRPNFWRSRR